jgi:hypothetical protein
LMLGDQAIDRLAVEMLRREGIAGVERIVQ